MVIPRRSGKPYVGTRCYGGATEAGRHGAPCERSGAGAAGDCGGGCELLLRARTRARAAQCAKRICARDRFEWSARRGTTRPCRSDAGRRLKLQSDSKSTVCESLRKDWFCQMFTTAELRFCQAQQHAIWNGCFTLLPLIGISSHDAGPLAVRSDSQAGPGSDDAGPCSHVHVGTNAAAGEISDQQERARADASSQPTAQNVRIGQDWAGLASRPALRQACLRQTDIGSGPSHNSSRP